MILFRLGQPETPLQKKRNMKVKNQNPLSQKNLNKIQFNLGIAGAL